VLGVKFKPLSAVAFAKLDPSARLRPFSSIAFDGANRPKGPVLSVEADDETTPRRVGAVTAQRPKRSEGAPIGVERRPSFDAYGRLTATRRRGR
jgi:hypothetical protein